MNYEENLLKTMLREKLMRIQLPSSIIKRIFNYGLMKLSLHRCLKNVILGPVSPTRIKHALRFPPFEIH
jgi:hypothetical protein